MTTGIPEPLRVWANSTLACGFLGGGIGVLQGVLGGGVAGGTPGLVAPTPLLAAAYSVNGMLVGGVYFAFRGAILQAMPTPATPNDVRWASTGAGMLTGFGAWGMFGGGLRRAPLGAAILGGTGLLGQVFIDSVAYLGKEGGGGQLRLGAVGKGPGVSSGGGRDGGESTLSLPTKDVQPQHQPSLERPGTGRVLSWFPVTLSPRDSDEFRLQKERRRLQELNEVLGFAAPAVHPKAIELARREKEALEALGRKSSSK